jgi:hypothetical protein
MRLRIPERRRDAAFFALVQERLSGWPNVERVEVNPTAASVLVRFADDPNAVARRARESDLFALDEFEPDRPAAPILEEARHGFHRADARLRQLTGGAGDLRSLVLLALLAGGLYQLVRGNIAAPAVTLLWYAGDMLRIWREEEPDTAASPTDDAPPP